MVVSIAERDTCAPQKTCLIGRKPGYGDDAPMSSNLIISSDLTGKARLRQAALYMFATKGFVGSSLRRIAQRAGVSLALIGHHYGGKAQLREAVDQWVIHILSHGASGALESHHTIEGAIPGLVRHFESTLASQPEIRIYLRRAVLDDTRSESQILSLLLHETRSLLSNHLESSPLNSENELQNGSSEVCTKLLGPLVVGPTLRRIESTLTGVTERSSMIAGNVTESVRTMPIHSMMRPISSAGRRSSDTGPALAVVVNA